MVSPEMWQEGLDLDYLFELIRSGQMDKVKKLLRERLGEAKDS